MKSIYILCLGALFLSACKKAKTDTTTADLLTAKTWKYATVDNNVASNPKSGTLLYAPIAACLADNVYTFGSDGKLIINNGSNHCDAGEGAVTSYSYSIDKTNNTIIINGTLFTIAEITETQLKYYAVVPGTSGVQNLVYIFQH
jgi:hypothetical protein